MESNKAPIEMKRVKILGGLAILLLLGIFVCGLVFTINAQLKPRKLKTAEDLCLVLGRDPDKDVLCHGDKQLFLLQEVFPIRVTTRTEVHDLLGEYHLHSGNGSVGSIDTYIVQEGFLGVYRWVEFSFDHDEILKHIGVYD